MSPPNLVPLPEDQRCLTDAKPAVEDEDPADTPPSCEDPLRPEADSDDDDDAGAEVVIPPDGGWGWMVVLGSFTCNLIVDGIICSFSAFLKLISEEFGVGRAQVALVGSLLSGFYLIVGPFASALANRFGFRTVAVVGSVVGALAFALSYFATSVEFLCVTYGIVGGIGFGLIFVPAVITIGYYFEKWRALATGIGVCGSGIGAFVFPHLNEFLINSVGWRGALLCQAVIILSCALFGATFRPIKPTKIKDLKSKNVEKPLVMDKDKLPLVTRLKMERILQLQAAHKEDPDIQGSVPRILGVNNNSSYPTASDVYHTISDPEPRVGIVFNHEKRLSVPLIAEKDKPKIVKMKNGSHPTIPFKRMARTRNDSESKKSQKSLMDINRPLYRDDIFFGGSLLRLPNYNSQNSVAYNLSVTHIPTKNDILEEKRGKCKVCPEAVRRALATMLDFSLFKSACFIVLAVSGFFTMMGFYVPFMYLKDRAEKNGYDEDTAVWLLSLIGIANTVGRLVSGALTSLPKVNVLLVNNLALTIGGLATVMSGLSMTKGYQFFYSIVFGVAISCFASLRSIIVVEYMGLDKLTNAFGLLLLFQGVAACVGSPVAGAFMEITGSFDAAFYIAGSLIFLSAVMCYPLNYIKKWEQSRKLPEKAVPV